MGGEIEGSGSADERVPDEAPARPSRPSLRVVPAAPDGADVTEATFGRLSQYAKAQPQLSDEVVAAAKRNGQEADAAWTAVYVAYAGGLRSYLHQLLRHPQDAEDIVSATFARAIGRIGSLRGTTANELWWWMYSIARNLAMDRGRALAKLSFVEVEDAPELFAGDFSDRLIAEEDLAQLRRALGRLDPEDREILWLRIAVGLSSDAVGKIVGKRPGTVRMQQKRALEALIRRWEQ